MIASAMDKLVLRTRDWSSDGAGAIETWLVEEEGALAIVERIEEGVEPTSLSIAPAFVEAVFARYGRPLEAKLPPLAGDDARVTIALADGRATLRAFSYRAPVDVIANDWLALDRACGREGRETVAAPAKLVVAALTALARAAARDG